MVGIVLVSHSAAIAAGVAALAREMAGPDVALEAAGGTTMPDAPLGTDAALVLEAIDKAYSPDGVLVLMDLGSAVLSAEMALDMLEGDRRRRVLLCEAPLVEGAVAAATAAGLGLTLDRVAAEARAGLAPKVEHLGAGSVAEAAPEPAGDAQSMTIAVTNRLGLHARPAALFARTAARFDADVEVTNASAGRGPANARSFSALATLGARQGHDIVVTARGPEATAALAALQSLAAGGFGDETGPAPPPAAPEGRDRDRAPGGAITGIPAAPGIAAGPVRRVRTAAIDPPARAPGDPEAEWRALERAVADVKSELRSLRASVARRAGEYEAAIFDAHILLLDDDALLSPARAGIFDGGLDAARAYAAAASSAADAYGALEDDYQRARADDVVAVGARVVARLTGVPAASSVAGAGILVAPQLSAADTAALDGDLVRGIATALGGATSHTAILARSLGIPAVAGLGDVVLALDEGTEVILDADDGVLYVEPPAEVAARYERRRRARLERAEADKRRAHEPAATVDGTAIEVAANAASAGDAARAVAAGADAIGLLRTEFLFMGRDEPPAEDEQEATLRDIARSLGGRRLIVRTLDAGADKPLPYLGLRPEDNPFLGVRGIRLSFARPELFAAQLRAVLRVAAEHPVGVMFPMVSSLPELRRAAALLARERDRVSAEGVVPRPDFEIGVMIEVPAAALSARALASEVDFMSIGTNDLAQYTLAADRGNDGVAGLADALDPAVLRLVREVVDAAAARGRRVAVCGEAASDAAAVPLLIGLGVTELSVAPPAVAAVKAAVRATDARGARAAARAALELESAAAVRARAGEQVRRQG